MSAAFVDSSCIVAMQLFESRGPEVRQRLSRFDTLHAASLLEAEVFSAVARERRRADLDLLDHLMTVHPARSLRPEIERVLAAGYVRGADCLHLATALYLAPDPAELTFLTLDDHQRAVAEALGFAV